MNNLTVPEDMFAIGLTELVSTSLEGAKNNTSKEIARAARAGAKLVRKNAEAGGLHKWSKEYTSGFSSHVTDHGGYTTGEIGNRTKPGLVHLLEKGHATINGGKTNAYPHMKPAFEEISRDLLERIGAAVEEGLRS